MRSNKRRYWELPNYPSLFEDTSDVGYLDGDRYRRLVEKQFVELLHTHLPQLEYDYNGGLWIHQENYDYEEAIKSRRTREQIQRLIQEAHRIVQDKIVLGMR